ncbi:MAG: glycosyltransferase [Phycisphaerae bacterium]
MSEINHTAEAATALRAARTVLVLRTDAIGDNVLASALLPHLRAACSNARLVYACQDRVADLFTVSPHLDHVVQFNRGRAYADEGYRQEVIATLRALHADIVLTPMFTREPLCDVLTAQTRAPLRIGFLCDSAAERDASYTHLVEPRAGWGLELARVSEFLDAFDLRTNAAQLRPEVPLTPADLQFAHDFCTTRDIDPARAIVLFAGALAEYRIPREIAPALAIALNPREYTIISLGAAPEFALHEEMMRGLGFRHLNLCGRTSIRQTAALLQRAQLAVGAETGSAHLACAVGTRNVVVLGGGHFGRFMPWSPLTTAASVPLECFQCDWKCRHAHVHCIRDVQASTIAAAIRTALQGNSPKPRLVVQTSSASEIPTSDIRQWIDPAAVEIIPVAGDPASVIRLPSAPPSDAIPPAFRVTAIVSTYNAEHLLAGCLQDLVDQTLFARGELEILIIDSASPTNERAIVDSFQRLHGDDRIRCIRTAERETLYAAWNRGIDAARGQYLTNANTDDRHHPEMLEILADTLDQHPDAVLAYADSDVTHDENASWSDARRVKHLDWPDFDRNTLFENNFAGPHPMWRRTVHDEVGCFDSTMISSGDYEFWLRLALQSKFIHVPRRLGLYLENPNSISLGNAGLAWYESQVARQRYWNQQWGENPGTRHTTTAFRNLAAQIASLPENTCVALFGAGQHTKRHIERFIAAIEPHARLAAILDDRASTGAALAGRPIIAPADAAEFDIQAVVISSDTYEAALAARAMEALPPELPILALYRPDLGRSAAPESIGAA